MSKSGLAAIYLARAAEGAGPVTTFAQSYRRHTAGIAHRLVVIFKSDDQNRPAVHEQKAALSGLDYEPLAVPDDGVDITAYLKAASQLSDETLCFLNTFSEIRVDGWLALLYRASRLPDAGLVGATGSYESIWNSMRMLSKIIWLCQHRRARYDSRIEAQFGHELIKHAAAWMSPSAAERASAFLRSLLRLAPYDGSSDAEFAAFWKSVTEPQGSMAYFTSFPPFPNIHIRTNAFLISRRLLLDLASESVLHKNESFLFESGRTSITAKVRALGLEPLVVDRHGVAHRAPDWPHSQTFRSGDQQNLIVADNQTRSYQSASPELRRVFRTMTWCPEDKAEMGSLKALWADFSDAAMPAQNVA